MLAPVSERLRKYLGSVVASQAEIAAAVKSLAQRIEDHYLPGDFGLVPILPKSTVFYSDLFRAIRIPVRAFPSVVSYIERPAQTGGGYDLRSSIYSDDSSSELPSRMLVVNAIADSASAALYDGVVSILLESRSVHSVMTCALLRMQSFSQKAGQGGESYTKLDFTGIELDLKTSDQIVGYGLTYKGHFGQLPCLTTLKKGF